MIRALGGFVAGFVAVLTLQQALLWTGTQLHWLNAPTWSMKPVPPFGIPQVFSLAFWGGVWGIVVALLSPRIGTGFGYWFTIFVLFGLATTLVSLTFVNMLRGREIEEITLARLLPGTIVNGAWAVGVAFILSFLPQRFRTG